MTLPIVEFFTSRITGGNKGDNNRPMFTSIPTSTFSGSTRARIGGTDNFDAKLFWLKFERSPELVGTLSIPITDIIGERPCWTKPDGSPLSKKKRNEIEKFWRDNRGKETLRAFLFDAFLTGDGYLWKAKPDSKQIAQAVKEVLKNKGINLPSLQMKELLMKTDEDLKRLKKLDYIPSQGTRIIHDEFEILGYEQESNGLVSRFDPEEVIHYRYLTINGRVNGFSPVKSLWAEILLLELVKQNMTSFLENGGSPDKMFILPKEIANSKNHQFLISQLMKYKKIQNRHGNLVFTGDIDVKDLQGNPKDLEYKDLALYITSNIAFAYGIPSSRIPYLIGSAATESGGGNALAETGYWNKISDFQDSIEDLLNSQIFDDMKVAIKFPRRYKQDEVREVQVESMHADSVLKFQQIFEKQGKQLTTNKLLELMDWNEEDIEENNMIMTENNPMQNQNMQNNSELEKGDNEKFEDNSKRNAANSSAVVENIQNP